MPSKLLQQIYVLQLFSSQQNDGQIDMIMICF